MQWGGGLETAWGLLTQAYQVYDLLQVHIYYRGVNDRVLVSVSRSHSKMVDSIVDFLTNGQGTLILVGHDTDLDAMAELFGMSWHTYPFPPNATTPGSMLRFDADGNNQISATMHFQSFNGTDEVSSAPAFFTWAGSDNRSNVAALSEIETWLKPRLDPECM